MQEFLFNSSWKNFPSSAFSVEENLAHLNSFTNWKFNKQGSAMNKRGVNFRGGCTASALPPTPAENTPYLAENVTTLYWNALKMFRSWMGQGWSFKMANKWSLINATWGNAQHLLFLLWTIDKNGWFWYFYRQDLLILPKQRINILDDACNFETTSSHFGDEKQQNGSPNQQNVNPYQQSGLQKREIIWYISTSGV